ncbi:MAG: AIR synthase-related protein [Halodesulfurarchaeum sp.]
MSDDNRGETPGDQFDHLGAEGGSGLVEPTEEMTDALLGAVGYGETADEFAGMIDIGDRYLGLRANGVGAKLSLAQELGEYAAVGTDCVALPVNDLVADGLTPVAFVNYLGVDEADETVARMIASGLAEGAEQAGLLLLGGEMSVKPDAISGFDLVGTAAGVAEPTEVFPGDAATGDRLVGFPASGIHASGVEMARSILESEYEYSDPVPGEESATIGERLLQPTRLYSSLLSPLRESTVHAAVHVAAGGLSKLTSMGEYRYSIIDPIEPPPLFDLIQETGDVDLETMYRTFTMGTGFVVALPESAASEVVSATDGRIIGVVERGSGVNIRGMELD